MPKAFPRLVGPSTYLARTGALYSILVRTEPTRTRSQTTEGPRCLVFSVLYMANHFKTLFQETEAILERWKHPEPYRPPTAPGGTANQRF